MPVVDFCRKIEILCAVAGIGSDEMVADLEKPGLRPEPEKPGIVRRISRGWLINPTPTIHSDYRSLFVQYWAKKRGVAFDSSCYEMPLDFFITHLIERGHNVPKHLLNYMRHEVGPPSTSSEKAEESNKARQHRAKRLQKFVGTYQILRPNAALPDRYVLEAMEIGYVDGELYSLMYSHNACDLDHLYAGKAHSARRYFFSLLQRMHEDYDLENSFRSIVFYVGTGAANRCLSGIMLRGVKGEDAGTRAVGVPFIALKLEKNDGLKSASFIPVSDEFYRLHPKGYVLVGKVDQDRFPSMFHYCKSLFSYLLSNGGEARGNGSEAVNERDGLFGATEIVLHTVSPSVINSALDKAGLGLRSWVKAVDEAMASTTDS